MLCPACLEGDGHPFQQHDVHAAAEHFVPKRRDPDRHLLLVEHLRTLWGQDFVEIQQCPMCEFGFAVPWVGGDARFYALAHAGDPHYPSDRWEFGETLRVLAAGLSSRPFRAVEFGAGDGAFLNRIRQIPSGDRHTLMAADFDEGAVTCLRERGFEAIAGSLEDVVELGREPFDVAFLFQTLEHMADLDAVFGSLRRLIRPGGAVFLSVPHSSATAFQEAVTGLWDMPPNHVGRWNERSIRAAAEQRGFTLRDLKSEPVRTLPVAWQLAVLRVNGRSYAPGTLASRINGLSSRPVRGVLKRVLAGAYAPRLLLRRRQFKPLSCWAHLEAPA